MTEETEQPSLFERLPNSKLFKLLEIAILFLIISLGITFLTRSGQSTTANIVTSVMASAAALVAISVSTTDRQIDSIENRLYQFYYPLEDYIEGYSMLSVEQDKKDIERIGHYRRLATAETRKKFEAYRNGNYRKEDGINLLPCVRCDIGYYEKRLKKLNK